MGTGSFFAEKRNGFAQSVDASRQTMVQEFKPWARYACKQRRFRRERMAAMCLRLIGQVAHFLSRPTQDRSDAMFRHADRSADFLVALSF